MNSKQQRPSHGRDFSSGLKLHLHLVSVGDATYHVITPRLGTDVRFSTNYYHETWHILSNAAGARLLGRLLWGLAFQKLPNTLVYLGGEFLAPTPFDAEPSHPIVLVPAHLTPATPKKFAALRERLSRLGAPNATVRWQTWGLDEMLDWPGDIWEHPIYKDRQKESTKSWDDMETMGICGGLLCYSAMPLHLKTSGYWSARLTPWKYNAPEPMDYCDIACLSKAYAWRRDGEIQVFTNYRQMLRDADLARREIAEAQGVVTCNEADRLRVQRRALKIRSRRTAATQLCQKRRREKGGIQ